MTGLTVQQASGHYQGQFVSDQYRALWRRGGSVSGQDGSRFYAGAARRQCYVFLRRGELRRSMHKHPVSSIGRGVSGMGLPGGVPGQWWYADWTPLTAWENVVNLQSVTLTQDFTNNGVATASIEMSNVSYTEQNKGLGLFHLIQRGFYSPLYGYRLPGQPARTNTVANEWLLKMPNAQILVVWGYGTEIVPAFVGLVDDLDLNSKPSTMTLSCRDFGGVLVDQVMFGDAKDRRATKVTFVPRKAPAGGSTKKVGAGATASSTRPGYGARNVTIIGSDGHWESGDNKHTDDVEWIEVILPKGRYRQIYVDPAYPNQDLYVGFYLTPIKETFGTFQCQWRPDGGKMQSLGTDDIIVEDNDHGALYGFWTQHNGLVKSDVPKGQWPWIKRQLRTHQFGRTIDLGGELYCGDGTRLRIGVRNLYPARFHGDIDYRAGIQRLCAFKEEPAPKVSLGKLSNDQIPVDDVSEIVELLLMWAGFKEWEIESAGVTLQTPLVVDYTTTFMDLLKIVRDQLGYVFFISEPTPSDETIAVTKNGITTQVPITESLGVPIFRQTRVLENTQTRVEAVTERDLLEDAKIKYQNTAERAVIRARGNLLAKKKGGQKLANDPSYRAMYTYITPWQPRMAGVLKHLTHYDVKYQTVIDCRFACYLIALQIALSSWTANIEIPGTSHIGLDGFVSIGDSQTGLDGRLYITNRSTTYKFADTARGGSSGGGAGGGAFATSLAGAMPDTPDVLGVVADWIKAAKTLDRNDR